MYACCPFHMEKTPSFTVNTETGEWYCHAGCGGGAEKEFISKYFDVNIKVAKYAVSFWESKGYMPFPDELLLNAVMELSANVYGE